MNKQSSWMFVPSPYYACVYELLSLSSWMRCESLAFNIWRCCHLHLVWVTVAACGGSLNLMEEEIMKPCKKIFLVWWVCCWEWSKREMSAQEHHQKLKKKVDWLLDKSRSIGGWWTCVLTSLMKPSTTYLDRWLNHYKNRLTPHSQLTSMIVE